MKKMNKIKLLFDVEQLNINGLKGTGVVRVCDVLFNGLVNSQYIDLYPIVTSKYRDIKKYLEVKFTNKEEYKKIVDKIIYLPKLKSTTKDCNLFQIIKSKIYVKYLFKKYKTLLSGFDAYISPFSSISPIIYKSGIKTFHIIHDLIPIYYSDSCYNIKFARKYINWFEKQINSDVYFCVSEHTKKDLCKFRTDLDKKLMYIMYLGADEKFKEILDENIIQSVKNKYNINNHRYFLSVSEITSRKNLVHLINAFVIFLKNTKAEDILLVLVGPIRKKYKDVTKHIKDLDKYQNKIIQTGFVEEQELAPLYSGAVAFIYPSLYEGFGLPVLEAMQCGTPVICSNNTSLPEVGGNAVLYISGYDSEETASKLNLVYSNNNICKELKEKGLQQSKKFNWNKTIEVVESVIKNSF